MEHHGIEYEDEDEAEREHERQPQRREDGRKQRIQESDHERHGERAAVPDDVDARKDQGGDPERGARQRPRQQQPERPEPRPFRLPRDSLAVGTGGWIPGHRASPRGRSDGWPFAVRGQGGAVASGKAGWMHIGR